MKQPRQLHRALRHAAALPLLLAVLLLVATHSAAHAQNVKRRGRLIKTETIRHEDTTSFDVVLEQRPNAPVPFFKIYRLINRTFHQINVYETVLEPIRERRDADEPFLQDTSAPIVIPNEFIRANPTTRTETLFGGSFPNETFNINGLRLTTDEQGCVPDASQTLFALLDDLNTNVAEVAVSHPVHGTRVFTFTRLILRPAQQETPAYRQRDPKATLDILEALDLDFSSTGRPGRTSLSISCSLPETAAPGDLITLRADVTNTGNATAGNVILCSFSREPWLDTKLFYIGNLAPGQTRSFSRILRVADGNATTIAGALAAWDTLQAHPHETHLFTIRRTRP